MLLKLSLLLVLGVFAINEIDAWHHHGRPVRRHYRGHYRPHHGEYEAVGAHAHRASHAAKALHASADHGSHESEEAAGYGHAHGGYGYGDGYGDGYGRYGHGHGAGYGERASRDSADHASLDEAASEDASASEDVGARRGVYGSDGYYGDGYYGGDEAVGAHAHRRSHAAQALHASDDHASHESEEAAGYGHAHGGYGYGDGYGDGYGRYGHGAGYGYGERASRDSADHASLDEAASEDASASEDIGARRGVYGSDGYYGDGYYGGDEAVGAHAHRRSHAAQALHASDDHASHESQEAGGYGYGHGGVYGGRYGGRYGSGYGARASHDSADHESLDEAESEDSDESVDLEGRRGYGGDFGLFPFHSFDDFAYFLGPFGGLMNGVANQIYSQVAGVSFLSGIHGGIGGFIHFRPHSADRFLRLEGELHGLSAGRYRLYVHQFGDISRGCQSPYIGDDYSPFGDQFYGGNGYEFPGYFDGLDPFECDHHGLAKFGLTDNVARLWGAYPLIGRTVSVYSVGAVERESVSEDSHDSEDERYAGDGGSFESHASHDHHFHYDRIVACGVIGHSYRDDGYVFRPDGFDWWQPDTFLSGHGFGHGLGRHGISPVSDDF